MSEEKKNTNEEKKNEVTKQQEQKPADMNEKVAGVLSRGDLSVLKNTLAGKGVNEQEFHLFVKTAAAANLNPFLNHIYCIKYKDKMNIQISVEGIQHLARQKEGFLGYDSQVVCENDDFEAGMEDGNWSIKKHNIKFPRGKVAGAYAVAKRSGYDDVIILMDRTEVENLEKSTNIWRDYYADMFKKHVLKRALRQQFGIELDDSFNAEGGVGEAESKLTQSPQVKEAPEYIKNQIHTDKGAVNEEDARAEIINRIIEKQNEMGMIDEDLHEFALEKFGKEPKDLNAQQLTGLEKVMAYWEPKEGPKQEEKQEDELMEDDLPNEMKEDDDELFFENGLV